MSRKRSAETMSSTKTKCPKTTVGVPSRTLSAAVRKAVYGLAEKKRVITHINEEPLGSIAQGSNTWQLFVPTNNSGNAVNRIGKEVTLSGMNFKGVLHNNGTTNNVVRIIIGYYKDTQAFSSASQIFESTTGFGGAVGFTSINNLDSTYWSINKVKFQPLLDRCYVLAPTSSVDAGNVKLLDYKLKLGGKIKFEGTDVGPDGQDKNLMMLAWTGEAGDDATLGTTVEISGLAQVWFTDL